MTPAIFGLTYIGFTQIPISRTPSFAHHVARFVTAVAMVTFLAAVSFTGSPSSEPGSAIASGLGYSAAA